MTISELRRHLNAYLSNTVIRPGKSGMHINLTTNHFEVAKYACTTEEKEFTFYKGKVFFKGFELKRV
jgi:hypothetical protein